MNLDELQSVQSRERQTDQLQQLRATFYEEAGEFIAQLREERSRAAEQADDPFDAPEVNHLTDDINTAEQTIEAIYERRVGKIVKMASLAAADMPMEDGGLTQEERTLFETMVQAIKDNRNHVLDVVSGEASASPVDASTTAGGGAESQDPPATDDAVGAGDTDTSGVDAADVMGASGSESPEQSPPVPDDVGGDRPPDEAAIATSPDDSPRDTNDGDAPVNASDDETSGPSTDVDDAGGVRDDVARRTVRITDDVGEIFGVDEREYDLSRDDVVTLPSDNADPLVEQDAAEPLE
jgi:DNA replication factor GINS